MGKGNWKETNKVCICEETAGQADDEGDLEWDKRMFLSKEGPVWAKGLCVSGVEFRACQHGAPRYAGVTRFRAGPVLSRTRRLLAGSIQALGPPSIFWVRCI